MEQLIQTLSNYEAGQEVTLTIIRDRQKKNIKVTLGERPASVEEIQ